MKKTLVSILVTVLLGASAFIPYSTYADKKIKKFVAMIPGQYVGKDKNKTFLGILTVNDKFIEKIEADENAKNLKEANVYHLTTAGKYNVIYPGLIDLHNHTKQNIIQAWGAAKGQFANRFEWREWSVYKKSVSANMNPWIGYGNEINCAAFRWSELQAMVIGTTYLQGPHSCTSNFAIHKVEDAKAFKSKKKAVQGPTDLVLPGEMVFVWDEVRPLIESKKAKNYGEAITQIVHRTCPATKEIISDSMSAKDAKLLADKNWLKEQCKVKNTKDLESRVSDKSMHPSFLRYIYFVHKTIVGKINYLKDKNSAAIIGHLAEGRRHDPYNGLEFEIFDLIFGELAKDKNVNFVHAVGINEKGLTKMADYGMGIVWSPFSNLLLYGETLDLALVKKVAEKTQKPLLLSLGSDWTPTGSRGVLEELKLAKQYILKNQSTLSHITDEELFKMVTENPARMINHFHDGKVAGEAGIGTLAVGAHASFIATTNNHANPFTNLVETYVQNINLVVVDGDPIYGNKDLMEKTVLEAALNVISNLVADTDSMRESAKEFTNPMEGTAEDQKSFMAKTAKHVASLSLSSSTLCDLQQDKVMVEQNSGDKGLLAFKAKTGLDLDRFEDINKLLAFNILNFSANVLETPAGKVNAYKLSYFPPLFSCDDPAYERGGDENTNSLYDFVIADSNNDKFTINREKRAENRKKQKFGKVPKNMATDYGLEYDITEANY
jgi:cytosine/adenosine deaminase-related metal-dependent hydrolase